jgi:CRISPR/Cas system-associated endonuclease Cas1
LFDGTRGEFLTGDAIRFCVQHSTTLILSGGAGRPPIVPIEAFGETRRRTRREHRRAGGAVPIALAQAQCALDKDNKTLALAREIVRAKIAAQAEVFAAARPDVRDAIEQRAALLNSARTLTDILLVEAHASTAYWTGYRDAGLRPRKSSPRCGPRAATHPIAAMLNYCYVVEAGRVA